MKVATIKGEWFGPALPESRRPVAAGRELLVCSVSDAAMQRRWQLRVSRYRSDPTRMSGFANSGHREIRRNNGSGQPIGSVEAVK
jgi:hypothetical protein